MVEEGEQSLQLNVAVKLSDGLGDDDDESLINISDGIPVEVLSDFATPVSILNGPCQATLLALLVIFSISANACVIANIRHNCIKLRSNHFLLIQHLCVADLIGATLILPAPLVTSLRGRWEGGTKLCHLSSVVNVALWLQHVFMFVMLKVTFDSSCHPVDISGLRRTNGWTPYNHLWLGFRPYFSCTSRAAHNPAAI